MDTNVISWIVNAVIYGTVIAIASLGETINEKSGHLNLGVPGIMYLSGILSYQMVKMYLEASALPNDFLTVLIALAASFVVGALFGLIYSVMCVTFKCNQNVMGLAISAFGVGLGKFFSLALKLKNGRLDQPGILFNNGLPFLKDLPYVGKLLFGYGFLTYLTLVVIILVTVFFRKTRIGLNLKAVGESPSTADAVGINVSVYKYVATIIGCGLAGVGGMAYVFYFASGTWSTNNSIEAIGWLAIALVIFASWKPIHLIWGAPLFGFLFWASTYLPLVIRYTGFTGFTELLEMLPYFVTIVILIINSLRHKKENQPPESLGLSYFREER
jgi:ABC-type uncharacterized transport system permease subunit